MRYVVCAVRDRAADVFGTPFYSPSVGSAIRGFSDEVNAVRDGNQLNKHPEDFDLYELGVFEDNGGLFETGVPRQVAIGKDCFLNGKG